MRELKIRSEKIFVSLEIKLKQLKTQKKSILFRRSIFAKTNIKKAKN